MFDISGEVLRVSGAFLRVDAASRLMREYGQAAVRRAGRTRCRSTGLVEINGGLHIAS